MRKCLAKGPRGHSSHFFSTKRNLGMFWRGYQKCRKIPSSEVCRKGRGRRELFFGKNRPKMISDLQVKYTSADRHFRICFWTVLCNEMISRRYQIHSRTEPAKNIWGTKPGDTLICHFSTPHVPKQVILERLLEISIFFDSWPEDTCEKILSEVEKNSIRDFFGGGRGRRPIFDGKVQNSVLSRCWGDQTLTGSDSQI